VRAGEALREREQPIEQASEFQQRPKAWTVWQGLGYMGKGVVEAPGRAFVEVGITGTEVFLSDGGKQAQRQEPRHESVIHQGLGSHVAHLRISEIPDLRRVTVKVFQAAGDGSTEFYLEIEAGGVFAFEGDEITLKGQIVADYDAQADCQLNRKGLVIGGAQSQRCPKIVGRCAQVQYAKESVIVMLDGELFAPDV